MSVTTVQAFSLLGIALVGALAASNALSEDFPTRPIKILVGSAPGGNADTAARVLGFEMAKTLAQPIIMAFKLGAARIIAADAVAKAAPDGYTMLLVTGGHGSVGAAAKALPYDTAESFAMISTASLFPFLLVTCTPSPHQTLAAVLAAAKEKPDAVTFGSSGTVRPCTGDISFSAGAS